MRRCEWIGLYQSLCRRNGQGSICGKALAGWNLCFVAVTPHYIFPYNEYDMHNIQSLTRIDSGAFLVGNVRMFAGGDYYDTRFPQIDNSNGFTV